MLLLLRSSFHDYIQLHFILIEKFELTQRKAKVIVITFAFIEYFKFNCALVTNPLCFLLYHDRL